MKVAGGLTFRVTLIFVLFAVVMVTAVYEEELGRQCLKLGALDYITKPIDLRYLETSILSGLYGGGSR